MPHLTRESLTPAANQAAIALLRQFNIRCRNPLAYEDDHDIQTDVAEVIYKMFREFIDLPPRNALPKTPPVLLKVIAVSANQNAFGLQNMVMIGDNGEGWRAAGNAVNIAAVGDVFKVPAGEDIGMTLAARGFETPSKLQPDPSARLVRDVWPYFGVNVDYTGVEFAVMAAIHDNPQLFEGTNDATPTSPE